MKRSSRINLKNIIIFGVSLLAAAIASFSINMVLTNEGLKVESKVEFSEQKLPAFIYDDEGDLVELDIPTVESVDGGMFEDEYTGFSVNDNLYNDLGWAEVYDTSTPESFEKETIGQCIYALNRWGAQCVSLARVFWWSYADRDVSTCGTGMAKGMMDCAKENAGDDFDIYWKEDSDKIQAGDWLVFGGGMYGHVGMAMSGVYNGYVVLLGENQGGTACEKGGAAANLININIKDLIGFYRPKAYIIPEPTPIAPDTGAI